MSGRGAYGGGRGGAANGRGGGGQGRGGGANNGRGRGAAGGRSGRGGGFWGRGGFHGGPGYTTGGDVRSSFEVEDKDRAYFGSLEWEVDKDSISSANSYSPSIHVGGIPWRINVSKSMDGVYLGVFFNKVDDDYTLEAGVAEVELKLINHEGDAWTIPRRFEAYIEKTMCNWGIPRMICWKDVINENMGFIKDNKLTVQLKFALSHMCGFRKVRRVDFTDPKEPSHDVTLVIGGKKLYASKQYLSTHSLYFRKLFSNYSVNKQKEIELKDVDYKEFIELLKVIYPPYHRILAESVEFILKLGDRFEFHEVVVKAEKYLLISTKFTVAKKLLLAGKYRLLELQSRCMDKMNTAKEVTDLKKSEDFNDFTDSIKLALFDKIIKLSD